MRQITQSKSLASATIANKLKKQFSTFKLNAIMKKKQLYFNKSLSLNKETITELNEEEMQSIPGGQNPTLMSSCDMFSCSPDNCHPEENGTLES